MRELLLVGFLGHARQIPAGYIFSLGYPMGKWRRNGFEGISKKWSLKIGLSTIYLYTQYDSDNYQTNQTIESLQASLT